jgi:(E)-4-hydroxy-3-methylbut-2-enyl-diphosphate synthase
MSMLTFPRRKTRQIRLGAVLIGGGVDVVVQSMTCTPTTDVEATVSQIKALEKAGCEVVRVAVPDMEAARSLGEIKKGISIPIIADIHFDHELALEAVRQGVDGLRINPGNIGGSEKVREAVAAVRERKLPIRIGVNSGSVEKHLLEKYGGPLPAALVESALGHVKLLEDEGYHEIKISVKASSVADTIAAYRLLSEECDYPLHLGVTEAGTLLPGAIKSALGIGTLLMEGIGDTLRVSLTADPVEEVRAAYHILNSLGLKGRVSPEIISCPTCGRLQYDLQGLVGRVEKRLEVMSLPITVAIMGCAVNGPGEAKHADIGVAGGKGRGAIFRNGEVVATCAESELEETLMREIEKMQES